MSKPKLTEFYRLEAKLDVLFHMLLELVGRADDKREEYTQRWEETER